MKYIFKTINFIILAVVLQVLYFLALIYTLANLSPYIHYAMTALGIFIVFFILSGRDAAVYRLSWCVPILLFPAVMGVVYLFYNRRITGRKIENNMLSARKNSLEYLDKGAIIRDFGGNVNNRRLARYIEKTTGTPPAFYSDAEYFPQGEDFHKCLLQELMRAEKYIFIEFFIIERGVMWDEILSVLVKKRNEGVKIRLLIDGAGSLYSLPRGYYKNMRRMGIECIVFNPLRSLLSFRFNTRNHRKIAIIDGVTAFCGGLNLADNYINAKRTKAGHWKDSAVMVKGGAAWNFALSFLAMWEFLTRQQEDYEFFIPRRGGYQPLDNQNTASVWHDLPLDNESVSERIMLNFINRADDYIYIITPYLAPSEELITALCTAAKSGTDVRIMLPFIPDKFIVSMITKSNYLPLLEAGVRIFEYPPGFIHSKNIVADDSRAAVGTVNFDYRAFYMNHECGVCFFGDNNKIIADIKRDFTETERNSREITLHEHRNTGLIQRGVRRVCRVFAPLV
jgi:cardiolipin synthase